MTEPAAVPSPGPMDVRGSGRAPGWLHILVLVAFAAAAIVFTYPLIVQMSTHFAGDNIDVWLNMWANWWTRKALGEGLPFYYTTDVLYPEGSSLYFHSFSHTNTALWLVLHSLVGDLAAHNITTLVGFTLLGFGIYLVVYELTGRPGAGLVAGLATTFAPYHVWECVHPNIFSTHFLPFLLWALLALFRQPAWWRGVLVGCFGVLVLLSSWHQPMYAAVVIGPFLIYNLWVRRGRPGPDVWRALLVAALVGGVLGGPVVFPLLREQLRAGYAEPEIDWVFDMDLLAPITPSFLHPLWGDAVRPVYGRFPAPNRPAFVGYAVLALAILGLRQLRREHGWLPIAALLALVLALGTKLYVNGHVIISRLPWYDPIIGFVRTPIRFSLVLGQCLAVLAGLAAAGMLGGRSRRKRALMLAGLSILVLFEFVVWPFPTTQATVSPFYLQLAESAGASAIVQAPQDRQTDKLYMYWQTIHGKPMVNGHISRPPASAFDFIEGNAVTRAFAHREALRGRPGLGGELAALAEANVRYIVVHKELLPADLAADWIAALATRPVYEDDDLTVFVTQPEAGIDFGVQHDFHGLLLSQAWLETAGSLVLESHWSSPQGFPVRLTLSSPGGVRLSHELAVAPAPFSAVRERLPWSALPPGVYEITIQANDETLLLPQRLVVAADGAFPARLQPGATWGEEITLRGMDWHRLANTLFVDLAWEARRAPGADYSLFVHLLSGGGVLVAQFDGVPRDGTHPTTRWEVGERVIDRVAIDLRGVPVGEYRLALGWYVPATGVRLAGTDGVGQRLSEDRLVIDQAVVVP